MLFYTRFGELDDLTSTISVVLNTFYSSPILLGRVTARETVALSTAALPTISDADALL